MLSSYLTILPYNAKSSQSINFTGGFKPFKNPIKPKRNIAVTVLEGIEKSLVDFINRDAYQRGVSNNDFLRALVKHMPHIPKVGAVESKSAIVGNTKVTTLIDGEQIFKKTLGVLDYAEDFIQLEMFEFQNLSVDGQKWATNGAEKVAGSKEQQQILWKILKKKQARPDMPIQALLDAHKWYIDGHGKKVKHYGNQDMIRFLKQKGIDVVPYPRAAQGGSALQHIKLLIVGGKQGKKCILGGMNWGNHSAANHDACILLEELPGKKSSEIDNIIDHHFNTDWALSWKKIGETELVNGPITKEEQKLYHGINKEIKPENVEYVNLLKEFFDTPEAKNRYRKGKLDLIPANPLKKPAMQILGTKPRELTEVGKAGDESAREFLLNEVKTCKKMRAQLFVLTDKELILTVIKRVEKGELDAQFVISSDILKFPYCRMAYHMLKEHNIPLRVYKVDKSINQRLHSKWAVFDDKKVMIGSTNLSAMGLSQNLKKGLRDDCKLHTKKIEDAIREYSKEVREFEKELTIPPLKDITDYEILLKRRGKFKTVINRLEKKGEASITLGGQNYEFTMEDASTLNTIQGYYGLMKKLHNGKEKYKRGNNEISVVFESPALAKNVFGKQFDMDWKYSESEYEILKQRIWKIAKPANDNPIIPKKRLDKVG